MVLSLEIEFYQYKLQKGKKGCGQPGNSWLVGQTSNKVTSVVKEINLKKKFIYGKKKNNNKNKHLKVIKKV